VNLEELVNSISGFSSWSHADTISFFAWFVQSKRAKDRFMPADIKACYSELGMNEPSAIQPFLVAMEKRKPKAVLRDSRGYSLEKRVRDSWQAQYGQRNATAMADKLLLELSAKMPNLAEQSFLDEAVICFRHRAFRAAIVMTWNLAYDHLCGHVLSDTQLLQDFNAQLPKSFRAARISVVNKRDDFAELKESEVLQVCRSSNIITGDVFKILKEKLDKRNTAAHPSTVVISPHTAEEYIIDLVTNVVLKHL
jgi:hypothetical protein